MAKELSESHKKALAKGREKARKEKRIEAVKRVEAYMKWLKDGSVLSKIPCVPTDEDFAAYRAEKGIVR